MNCGLQEKEDNFKVSSQKICHQIEGIKAADLYFFLSKYLSIMPQIILVREMNEAHNFRSIIFLKDFHWM